MNEQKKKTVFSGVQPSGKLHIGNYIGAISQWVDIQHDYNTIFCVVDLHAMTIPENIDPKQLRAKSREVAGLYIASGIDPEESAIFVQADVREHTELAWILNCATPLGWLERMTQYKSKASKLESVSFALLAYPVLMAADILLYDAELVPVGEDQKQHIELTRDVAQRFNNLYGETFVIPEPMIRASGARVMGFDDPESKMSKSVGEQQTGHSIGLLDDYKSIKKTVMSAKTDCDNVARFDGASPGVLNMLTLYEVLTRKSREEIEAEFDGKGYGTLKKQLLEAIMAALEPIQKKYAELTEDPHYLDSILMDGAERVRGIAEKTMARVRQATGTM